ncbi:MAG: pilus assembly protein [Sphingomonadales bacterium]|nr:pilus assembly protein [Sphingomonadales bacterium]
MIRRLASLRKLRRDNRATAILEFALTAPVFLLLIMGIFDYCWQMYAQQVLQGAVSQSARSSTLEGYVSDPSGLDAKVRSQVLKVFKNADVHFSRKAYESFSEVSNPETFDDRNGNGVRDPGECFEDVNNNGTLDNDRGSTGNGSADDVVLYTASMKFKRVLPVWRVLGMPQETTLSSSTILRNQPYSANTSTKRVICT